MPRYFIYDRHLYCTAVNFHVSVGVALTWAKTSLPTRLAPYAVEPAPPGAAPTPPLTYKEREDAPLSH